LAKLAGGGVALLRARANIKVKGDNPDQEAGIKIVLRAIEEPNLPQERAIVSNAGEEPSDAKGQPGMGGMGM
jgi:chaperonin GroEL